MATSQRHPIFAPGDWQSLETIVGCHGGHSRTGGYKAEAGEGSSLNDRRGGMTGCCPVARRFRVLITPVLALLIATVGRWHGIRPIARPQAPGSDGREDGGFAPSGRRRNRQGRFDRRTSRGGRSDGRGNRRPAERRNQQRFQATPHRAQFLPISRVLGREARQYGGRRG